MNIEDIFSKRMTEDLKKAKGMLKDSDATIGKAKDMMFQHKDKFTDEQMNEFKRQLDRVSELKKELGWQ